MEREIYDRIRSLETDHWWFVGRRAILGSELSRLGLPAEAEIVEVGCGTGGNLSLLQRFGAVRAIEPDDDARRHAAETASVQVERGFLPDRLPYRSASFDLVCAFDVVEHVDDDAGAVAALGNLARPGGWVVTTVPAYQWMWSRHDELHHHKRRYTLDTYRPLFDTAGLRVERATYFNTALLGPAVAQRWLKKALKVNSPDDAMPGAGVNSLLARIFSAEAGWLKRANLPLGLSILLIARRPAT